MRTTPEPEPDAPTPLPRARELHLALYSFVESAARRRVLPSTLHIGVPSLEDVTVTDPGTAALRADHVELALACVEAPAPFAWLTRLGELVESRDDHRWFAATAAAFATHGLDSPDFYVVTRRGWLDLATGDRQVWHRVRPARLRPDLSRPA